MVQNNIFIYGSLMHPDEMSKIFNKNIDYKKAKLNGYVRDFSKESQSWGNKNESAGVLGLIKCDSEWCNGLIVKNVSDESLNNYYIRETGMSKSEYDPNKSGYIIKEMNRKQFNITNDHIIQGDIITSVINNRLEKPNTPQEYKNICYNAAKEYDNSFYEDFVRSTYEYYKFNI